MQKLVDLAVCVLNILELQVAPDPQVRGASYFLTKRALDLLSRTHAASFSPDVQSKAGKGNAWRVGLVSLRVHCPTRVCAELSVDKRRQLGILTAIVKLVVMLFVQCPSA